MADMIRKYVVFTRTTKNIVGCYSRSATALKQATDANNAIQRIQYETGLVVFDPVTKAVLDSNPHGLRISQIDEVIK